MAEGNQARTSGPDRASDLRALDGRGRRRAQADPLELPEGTVHLWVADHHRVPDGELESYSALLDASERHRASRFRFPKDFRRFVVGHGRVRSLLGLYSGGRPDALTIARRCRTCGSEEHGKPSLLLASGAPSTIRFSCSYSDRLVVVAVANGVEIGVDVERVSPGFAWRQVAGTALSPGETSVLDALDDDSAAAAFYGIWTRKEAVSKASGRGVEQLTQMDTCAWAQDEAGRFEVFESSPVPAWTGRVLDLPGHAAAVAVEGATSFECRVMERPADLRPLDVGA